MKKILKWFEREIGRFNKFHKYKMRSFRLKVEGREGQLPASEKKEKKLSKTLKLKALSTVNSKVHSHRWDSMAQDDLPAMIDQALLVSGRKYVYYSRIPVYFSHFPAGTSSLNMLHWVQMVRTGATARLDRGMETNKAMYGQETPPAYNFRDIPKIPIYLFSGGNDWIADDDDTYGSLLPLIGSIIQQHTHLPNYNHFDFVFGLRATADVYKPIMSLIQKSLQ
ncbi:hypothetical protein TELCIR_12208 [Teladorsagia circumcincta]|uniref:Uncharacterized protein n=1 Tax=Teladorsagia circumcincta TaxID=45464 RepID=A0A2G9U788_TELCI|nr:hypothetical protein TELCIR_12208 [Teladorsagia circumcincta]